MSPAVAYKMGQRAGRAWRQGDESAARVLMRDVVRSATLLRQRGKGTEAYQLVEEFDKGKLSV
jgi:hypothetical protein